MSKINFTTEYNKLLGKFVEYKDEYDAHMNNINIKMFINMLDKYNIFDKNTREKLDKFFNIFTIKKEENEIKFIPHISSTTNKLKIKRKQLLVYLHPDKIDSLYNIKLDLRTYFTQLIQKVNSKQNMSSHDILSDIYKTNEQVFELVISKLTEKNLISNNEIKNIKKISNIKIYTQQHSKIPKNKYDVWDIFPFEINHFVSMYNTLNKSEPMQKFICDIWFIVSSIYDVLKKTISKIGKNFDLRNVNNITQLFKLAHIDNCYDILMIMKKFLPNSYVKMLSIFIIHNNLGYICDGLFIRNEYFAKELGKDYMYGKNNIFTDMIDLLKNKFSAVLTDDNEENKEKIENLISEIKEIKLGFIESGIYPSNIEDYENIENIEPYSEIMIKQIHDKLAE
jgi:LysM repeat protein